MTSYRSAIDIMQGPVKNGKKVNKSKNPGKSKDEKKVWQMYGYNANDSSDAQSADDEDDESFED